VSINTAVGRREASTTRHPFHLQRAPDRHGSLVVGKPAQQLRSADQPVQRACTTDARSRFGPQRESRPPLRHHKSWSDMRHNTGAADPYPIRRTLCAATIVAKPPESRRREGWPNGRSRCGGAGGAIQTTFTVAPEGVSNYRTRRLGPSVRYAQRSVWDHGALGTSRRVLLWPDKSRRGGQAGMARPKPTIA